MKQAQARAIAAIIYDKLGITFAQAVHGLMTKPRDKGVACMMKAANKRCEANGQPIHDPLQFDELVRKLVEWAK